MIKGTNVTLTREETKAVVTVAKMFTEMAEILDDKDFLEMGFAVIEALDDDRVIVDDEYATDLFLNGEPIEEETCEEPEPDFEYDGEFEFCDRDCENCEDCCCDDEEEEKSSAVSEVDTNSEEFIKILMEMFNS